MGRLRIVRIDATITVGGERGADSRFDSPPKARRWSSPSPTTALDDLVSWRWEAVTAVTLGWL
jgi:hypothetical protein